MPGVVIAAGERACVFVMSTWGCVNPAAMLHRQVWPRGRGLAARFAGGSTDSSTEGLSGETSVFFQ